MGMVLVTFLVALLFATIIAVPAYLAWRKYEPHRHLADLSPHLVPCVPRYMDWWAYFCDQSSVVPYLRILTKCGEGYARAANQRVLAPALPVPASESH